MMSSDKNTDDNSGCSRGKAAISNSSSRPPPAALNCPRCDSSNTKFCYYNNYSLSQPRHFCKTCKRYWTKGGALRNVPIGGGCRKNKKTTKASSRFSSADFKHNSSPYSNIAGGFKPFNGLEFQLGGGLINFPRYNNINISTPPQLVSSFRDNSTIQSGAISTFEFDPNNHGTQIMAFNSFPLSSSSSSSMLKQDQVDNFGGFSGGGGLLEEIGPAAAANTNNLASPLESLSSINQDLHWKLQQERFNMMFNGGSDNNNFEQQNGMISTTNHLQSLSETQKPQPILFQNLEVSTKLTADDSKKENNGIINSAAANLATTEFFFSDSSTYAPAVNQIPPTNSNSSNIGNGKGIQTWANFDDQYKALL